MIYIGPIHRQPLRATVLRLHPVMFLMSNASKANYHLHIHSHHSLCMSAANSNFYKTLSKNFNFTIILYK